MLMLRFTAMSEQNSNCLQALSNQYRENLQRLAIDLPTPSR